MTPLVRTSLAFAALATASVMSHAERSLDSSIYITLEAIERTGDTFDRRLWSPAETAGAGESVLNYGTQIDGKLTMDHQASARAQVVSGIELGDPGQGPRLKVALEDNFQFVGTPISTSDGAVWARSATLQDAGASVTTDLSFAAGSPTAHTLMFYWKLDGQVSYTLHAPQVPVIGAPANPLSVSFSNPGAVQFIAQQFGCAACGASEQFYNLSVFSPEVWTFDPTYSHQATMTPTILFVPFIVGNGAGVDFPGLSFELRAGATYILDNGDYQNLRLDGSMEVAFDNSATLLGVLPLDEQGTVVRGVQLLSSDADFSFPVLSAVPGVAAVPEPGSYALMLAGLAALGFVRRRARPRAAMPVDS